MQEEISKSSVVKPTPVIEPTPDPIPKLDNPSKSEEKSE